MQKLSVEIIDPGSSRIWPRRKYLLVSRLSLTVYSGRRADMLHVCTTIVSFFFYDRIM